MNSISVCIATYNGERFIEKQLNSIISQLGDDDEIIISDDSSTDKTVNIIKSYNDRRIKLFESQKFKSPAKNFEFAIKRASHEYIFLADQDDLWVGNKVCIMKKELQNYDLVLCDRAIIDTNDTIIVSSYFKMFPGRAKPGIIKNLIHHSFSGCCMAFNKKILKKALPFPEDIEYHDYWLGFIANLYFKVKFINVPLTLYRRHENNVSFGTQLKSGNTLGRKLQLRWNIVKYFPLSLFR